MAGDVGPHDAWVGWPVDRAVRELTAAGRRVRHRVTGGGPQGVGAELVLAVRDPGPPAPVTVVAAWVPGAHVAAWARGGGVS